MPEIVAPKPIHGTPRGTPRNIVVRDFVNHLVIEIDHEPTQRWEAPFHWMIKHPFRSEPRWQIGWALRKGVWLTKHPESDRDASAAAVQEAHDVSQTLARLWCGTALTFDSYLNPNHPDNGAVIMPRQPLPGLLLALPLSERQARRGRRTSARKRTKSIENLIQARNAREDDAVWRREQVLKLKDDGWSSAAIARELGLPSASAVDNLASRARALLKQQHEWENEGKTVEEIAAAEKYWSPQTPT